MQFVDFLVFRALSFSLFLNSVRPAPRILCAWVPANMIINKWSSRNMFHTSSSCQFAPLLRLQVMMLSLYCRALALPIEYLSLAHGDSRSFLFIETIYNVMLVTFTVLAHQHFSLFGAGVALTLSFFSLKKFPEKEWHFKYFIYLCIQIPILLTPS